MHAQPVIERELRVQARARETHWLRLLAGSAAAGTLGVALLARSGLALAGPGSHGPWLFALLHTTISVVLALACPLMSADTLARERREGTLGLLLLTPLRPSAIVLGKMTVHLLRAFTLWLAVLPVLVVPLLIGGVSIADIVFALALELGVVLGGLAAGLLASSFTEGWGRATALAAVLAAVIGQALALLSFLGLLPVAIANSRWFGAPHLFAIAFIGPWIFGTGLVGNGFGAMLAQGPAGMKRALFTSLALVVLGSVLAILIAAWWATVRVQRIGQDRALTQRQEARRRFWFQPRLARAHGRKRQARLQRNPLFWLYTLRPTARLHRWGWCGAVAVVWVGIILWGIEDNDTEGWVFGIPFGLVAALAFVSAASFRREMEDGSLELLLVSPLRPVSIVQARVLSMWVDFLPAFLISTVLSVMWMTVHHDGEGDVAALVIAWSFFVTVPFVGARFGVRRVNPFAGWAWTLAILTAIPMISALTAGLAMQKGRDEGLMSLVWFVVGFALLQGSITGLCAWLAIRDLATRQFQLKPLRRGAV